MNQIKALLLVLTDVQAGVLEFTGDEFHGASGTLGSHPAGTDAADFLNDRENVLAIRCVHCSLLYQPVSDDIPELPFKFGLCSVGLYLSKVQDIHLIGNGHGGSHVLVDQKDRSSLGL